jgi:hypothetical protein
MIKLKDLLNEEPTNSVTWPEFLRDTVLIWKSSSPMWDKSGNHLVDITLKSKPTANFSYKFSVKKANVDDYVPDRRLRYPIQVKQTIYNKFFNKF